MKQMKTFILFINFVFLNLVIYGQKSSPVLNIKSLEKSAQSITIAWVSEPGYKEWEIDIEKQPEPVNFKSLDEKDYISAKYFNITEPNVFIYRFDNLSPATTYYIFVKPAGKFKETTGKIEVTTNRMPDIEIAKSAKRMDELIKCSSYRPIVGKSYIVSAWVKKETDEQSFDKCGVLVKVRDNQGQTLDANFFIPSGQIIDGWQRIEGSFRITDRARPEDIQIILVNEDTEKDVYFDDIRIFPKNGNLKSYVYDFETKKLRAELDQNNYATFYEYDQEGGLIRIKKETERGVFTIQETRSHTRKQNNSSN